ncbi:MAG: TIGR02452 family protein [Myxococcales bacterium]|nr:TIGR02452 family protein [Myxococcales bacterium]
MARAGHVFYRSANGVWLTDHVPPEFLEAPESPDHPDPAGGAGPSRGAKVAIAKQTLAACEAGRYVTRGGATVELTAMIERAVEGTVSHDLGTYVAAPIRPRVATTAISVTGESTIEAIRRLAAGPGHVACLNFASAKNPGGGFLGGAQAQEESLARSSALYRCLQTQPAHYARNKANRSALYLDLAIYSPAVPFFRDDDGGWFDVPAACSVITCAAPNAGALRQHGRFVVTEVEAALRTRAAFVLAIARDAAIDHLILGAWGAGVFGNDPVMVARTFADLLRGPFDRTFVSVVFAVVGGPGAPNHDAFAATFPPS